MQVTLDKKELKQLIKLLSEMETVTFAVNEDNESVFYLFDKPPFEGGMMIAYAPKSENEA